MHINHLPLAGHLKHCLTNWELITSDPWVLETVRGLKLNFLSPPYQAHPPHQVSQTEQTKQLINLEIQGMLAKGAVQLVPPSQAGQKFLSTLFLVPKKGGGQRPVVNLRLLNHFLPYEHFKLEGIHMLRDLLRKGDYLIKIDLKDAYFTVPLSQEHQKFIRFLWEGTLYEFTCLPFGLAIAPRVFTKVLKPAVAWLRQLGIRLIIYLDDILILAPSKELAELHAATVIYLLENLGFMINHEKSILTPATEMEFLGFLVNSVTLTLSLPRDKIRKVRKECQEVMESPQNTIRQLTKLLGLLSSTIQAVFPAPLYFRHLQEVKNAAFALDRSYDSLISLSPLALEELTWWRDNLEAWNGKGLVSGSPDMVIETDASRKGWGAYCMGVSTGGQWTQGETQLHINCLELLAGAFAVQTFVRGKVCMKVCLLMDNMTAAHYINKMGGTKSPILARLAVDLWNWCLDHQIHIEAHYIPGVLNV